MVVFAFEKNSQTLFKTTTFPNEISNHEIGMRGEYQSLCRLSYRGVQLDAPKNGDVGQTQL